MSTQESAPPRSTGDTTGSARTLFRRSGNDRVIAGVAGGLGERLDADPVVLRLAFVALVLAGGAGVLLYLVAWALSSEPEERGAEGATPASSIQQTIAVSLVVFGALILLRVAGVWFGDAWVWPVALAAFGSALIWSRGDADVRARWGRWARRIPGGDFPVGAGATLARLAGGGLLIAAGMGLFLAANDALPALRSFVFAVAVTLAGGVLILGPGVLRLARTLSQERRERIRSQERAEMAAHLHDSVLQTLALLQRSRSLQEVTRLARRQERELRSWLYGRTQVLEHDHLSTAVDDVAARVESLHDVAVEVVVVGDRPLDDELRALVAALGEATTNAARHSGAAEVFVYVEVEPDEVNAFVRDQGKGFDPHGIDEDRGGIAHSIVGRMRRIGGEATVSSRIGEGTEVHLRVGRGP